MNDSSTLATAKLFRRLVILVLLCIVATSMGCGQSVPPDRIPMFEITIGEGPISVSMIRNDITETFSLTMHVAIKKRDATLFQKHYEQRKVEIIDRITAILLASTPDERMEAGCATIKEKAKQAINEVLGTPWVQVVLVSDVTYKND